MNYEENTQLLEVAGEIAEIRTETEEERAVKLLEEKYGGSIVEDLYASARQQRDDRIEDQYFSERG